MFEKTLTLALRKKKYFVIFCISDLELQIYSKYEYWEILASIRQVHLTISRESMFCFVQNSRTDEMRSSVRLSDSFTPSESNVFVSAPQTQT